MPAPPSTPKEARVLGDELQRDPLQHANNAVRLLTAVQECNEEPVAEPQQQQETVARAAIQALKLFFIAQHDAGAIAAAGSNSKRQKLNSATAAACAGDGDDAAAAAQQQYAGWLARQYGAFTSALLALLRTSSSASLQVAAVSALLECVRHEAGPAAFSNTLFSRVLTALVLSPTTQPEVLALLAGKYLACWDVRYHTLRTLSRLAQERAVRGSSSNNGSGQPGDSEDEGDASEQQQQQALPKAAADVARAMFDVLMLVQPVLPQQKQQQRKRGGSEDEEDYEEQEPVQSWCGAAEARLVTAGTAAATLSAKARRKRKQQQAAAGSAQQQQQHPAAVGVAWATPKLQQRAYQDAWLALLRTDLPADIYKKVLLTLHASVLPAMTSPLLLSDFLTHALDAGGFEGMLALNGIFTLVTRHGLEYPEFYARLYGLLTPDAFTSKHRAQFFQLADIFLTSGMVPAYTAAAFAKRMARLALSAPPAGAMLALAFVHNIVRRHPACMVLLHKPSAAATAGGGGGAEGNGVPAAAGVDVYDASEPDPAKSRAVESSLWEVAALRNHYSPQVAAMCAILDKDLSDRVRTSEVDVGPLLTASYASLLQQELGRKLRKGVPVAFYAAPPAALFDGAQLAGDDGLPGWDLTTSSA